MSSFTFHAGKFHVWEIGLLEDLLFFNSESGAQPAEQLRGAAGGGRQEEGCVCRWTPPPARQLLQLCRTGRAGSEQQLPGLLVCPQEDEAPQADGCHPWDNTCEQAERRRKGSFRGRAESGRCTAGCRSFGKQSQEKSSLAGFFNPTPLLTEGTCLGFPNRALPSRVVFNPSPHSSGAEAKMQEAASCAVELRYIPTKGCRQMGRVPSSAAPIQPRQRDPLSLPGAPHYRQPCSLQRLIPNNIQQGPAGREREWLCVQLP